MMTPRIFESLQLALEHSEYYRGGGYHPSEDGGPAAVDESVMDTAVAYKVSQECGRFINSHDWFLAFRQGLSNVAASSGEDHDGLAEDQANGGEPSGEMEAGASLPQRFAHAVAELHLLGIVAPSRKRKEHYERLLFFHQSTQPSP